MLTATVSTLTITTVHTRMMISPARSKTSFRPIHYHITCQDHPGGRRRAAIGARGPAPSRQEGPEACGRGGVDYAPLLFSAVAPRPESLPLPTPRIRPRL